MGVGDRFSLAFDGDNAANSHHVTQVQYSRCGIGSTRSTTMTYGIEAGSKFWP